MTDIADLELGDRRVEFVADYVLKTMKLKPDKWMKLYGVDENKQMILDFFEKQDQQTLIIFASSGGTLSAALDWPAQLKSKACYFVKKSKDNVSKEGSLRNQMIYGDLAYSPIDQLSVFVDEVIFYFF